MLKINKDIQIGDTGRTLEMLGETVAETLPVGTIAPYGGSTSQVPQNWLPCDGREVSRLEYAKLFSIIGTRFGVGDGSTTFALPNLQGKIPVGQDVNDTDFDVLGETGGEKTHTLTVSEMPRHNHTFGYDSVTNLTNPGQQGKVGAPNTLVPSWVTANAGGGQAHNNLQPYQVTLYIIKAFDQQLGNLRSESLPVGSEIDFDGTAEQIPEGWEATGEIDGYSTNEIKTSKTWIDGKPIYRKVINLGDLPNATSKAVSTGIINSTIRLTSLKGFCYNASGTYQAGLNDCDSRLNLTPNDFINVTTKSDFRGFTGYAIMEYTKTTD